MNKEEARKILLARRSEESEKRPDAAQRLKDVFTRTLSLPKDALLACYIATKDEMDPALLMGHLFSMGHKFCLPCETQKDQPLTFRSYDKEDVLRMGLWHIPEPAQTAPIVVPDILLLPLVGFDNKGHRLGRGGGFYDRTLKELRAQKQIIAIGMAFAAQELDVIPVEQHDSLLDAVVTEKAFFQYSTVTAPFMVI